jgi:anti-sigma regulatory factor (Ser/Thr protein kinase)
MEVTAGTLHTVFPMGDASRVGEARRHAAMLAQQAGLDEQAAGRLALVVTELGNNLVRHAHDGRLLIAGQPDMAQVEVISMDKGPGIADLSRCMDDGFSTGGTPGTGLGAIRRLSQDFEVHSAVPDGTIIIARIRSQGAADLSQPVGLRAAGICIAAPGETVCGDAWALSLDGGQGAVIVADGLGHGPEAAEASIAAADVFAAEPMAPLPGMLEQIHVRLRGTRGAAVALFQVDAQAASIRCCGAGNVVARVISGTSDRSMLTQHGTAGLQIRRPEEVTQTWPAHALLVIHSDGIETRWTAQRLMPVLGRDPLLAAAILMRDHCRGRDDATIVVVRRQD